MITKFFINKAVNIQKTLDDKSNQVYPDFSVKFKKINSQFEEDWGRWEKANKKKSSMP